MTSSFVVNLTDLNKILEQIKVAERNVLGEELADIIGQDASLLPIGLRTVDGSNNHLLPGQTEAGAADEIFPRLLTPTYINDADGDSMPLGPGVAVTNTNYDPTITSSSNQAGVNVHSVADADPRIISNLIVDQTLTNRSALIAALERSAAAGGISLTPGSSVAAAAADLIMAARDAAAAAAPFAAATAAAYAQAVTSAGTVQTEINSALASLTALRADAAADGIIDISTNASDAVTAATAALAAANIVLAALQVPGTTVAAADIASALAQVNALTTFVASVTAVQSAVSDGVTIPEYNTVVLAEGTAQGLATAAAANAVALSQAVADPAGQHLANLIADAGLELSNDDSILIEHRSPDVGLSPPNSAWMTFFGQFFDHGLDLVTKGNNGTIYIPLQADDPLIAGKDHILGTADDLAPELRFMTLSRVTPFDANGNPNPQGTESQNTTTPFVDQNQTYTSSASHQVFLREYKFSVDAVGNDGIADSHAVNTGHLLNGVHGGIANWAEVKHQAQEKLGLLLNDLDVLDVPKLLVDAYGKFTPGPNGFAQVFVAVKVVDASGALVSTVPGEFLMEGTASGLDLHHLPAPAGPGLPSLLPGQSFVVSTVGTGHAFLNDIAHDAVPVSIGGVLQPDDNSIVNPAGTVLPNDGRGHNTQYDDEMLNSHFVTGDGRGNENIGLTAVHTIFHSEHNRLVEANKDTIIASGDVAIVNEWLAADPDNARTAISQAELNAINALTDPLAKAAAIDALDWDGERLFQAARFVTEMQYQHLVFEEFARRIQPNVDPFIFTNSADLDPAIVAEFAHTVYRFGHSMLVDTVDRLNNDLSLVNSDNVQADDPEQVGLIEAFLNPQEFTAGGVFQDSLGNVGFSDEVATGALIRGMSRSVGNEIDEFVVEALRNNLLGLPLDLPALNLARGRDAGIPSLNEARAQIYATTGGADLKPYTSWADFTQHIKHPLSVINFIAAYGTHPLIAAETTSEGKRAAAMAIVLGTDQVVPANAAMQPPVLAHTIHAPADRLDFLNATGIYAADGAGPHDDSLGGLNHVDLWIGGLAEEINEFGGQLGSTFNFVFEYQLEHLQNGDRFYYLSRTQGMNLLNLLEPNTFTDLVMRNTDLGDLHSTHLPGNLMAVSDMILELDKLAGQENYSGIAERDGTDPADRSLLDPVHSDPFVQGIDPKVHRVEGTARLDANGNPVLDADGKPIFDGGILQFSGGEHVVLGGTEGNDRLYGDKGIDTLWGDGGDDYLNAGMESDQVFGGDGDDIIEDPFGDNFLRGEAGDDVITSDAGLTLMFGGEGSDFIMGATDAKEVFAGPGNDFVLGGSAPDGLMGNEGDDWIEGGEGFDSLSGENSELFFNSPIIGHDILNGQGNDTDYDGESGDDIMVQGAGIQRNNGMLGFDWSIQKGDETDGVIDLGISRFANQLALTLRDRNDAVEGASGWKHNDTLIGTSFPVGAVGAGTGPVNGPATDSKLLSQNVDLIRGLEDFVKLAPGAVVGQSAATVAAMAVPGAHFRDLAPDTTVFDPRNGGDILLGGAGSDTIIGNAGNDLIDGDRWLNVRISVHATKDPASAQLFTVDGLTSLISGTGNADWDGKSVAVLMRTGKINPGQLEAVREIISDGALATDTDVAVFHGSRADFTLTRNANGTVTVVDTVVAPVLGADGIKIPLLDDEGTDTLANIEIARFTNYDANGVPTGTFTDVSLARASGAPTITSTGTNVLTASTAGIVDANGIANTIRFQWQSSATGTGPWTNAGLPTANANRTVNDANFYRVIVSYIDGDGLAEAVTSQIVARVGTGGIDTLNGTADPNLINGLAANDTLNGLAGNDVLNGGAGADTLNGGADNDTLVAGADNVRDVLDGGAETDTADYSAATAALTVTLNGPTAAVVPGSGTITANADTIANIENFTGGSGNDSITGDTGDNVLGGGAGADTLNGGAGSDTLDGGANPNNTGDVMTGGAGNDTYVIDDVTGTAAQRDQVVEAAGAAGGIDTVTGSVDLDLALYANVENITLTGTANRNAAGNTSDNILIGNAGNNTLTGGSGNDTLTGGAGNDALVGGIGTDTAVFTGSVLDHTLTTTNAGVQTISGTGDGNDTLTTIEKVQFGATVYTTQLGTTAATTIAGSAGNELIFGLQGNDTINAGAGDDAIVWRAGDGRDVVNGGANGTVGDAFSITGDNSAEVFTVYSRLEWLNVAGNLASDLNANSDIVITRNGTGTASVVAELDQIEEISINTGAGNDSVLVVGNLTPSDLRFNTITVNSGTGDDTVDVTALESAHHVVLNTDGGSDHIVGMRAQDEMHVTGPAAAGGSTGGAGGGGGNGGGGGSGSGTENGGGGGAGSGTGNGGGGSGNGTGNGGGTGGTAQPGAGLVLVGMPEADVLLGAAGADNLIGQGGDDVLIAAAGDDTLSAGEGNDFVDAGEGRDMVFGGAGDDVLLGGAGNDLIDGEAGNDRILSGTGDDRITAGAGDDTVVAGAGHDVIVAAVGDGNDVYFGDDSDGGTGLDTLDLSAIMANLTVDLGTGLLGRGSAASTQSGSDTLWSIENVATGSGNDTITASAAVNVIEGGAGDDSFRFESKEAAAGDTILDFEPGDRLDLSGIDANGALAGDQSFTLTSGPAFTATAQLVVAYETRADGDYTVVKGNLDADGDADFQLSLKGSHSLSGSNFTL